MREKGAASLSVPVPPLPLSGKPPASGADQGAASLFKVANMDLTFDEINMVPKIGAEAFAVYCYIKATSIDNKSDPTYQELRSSLGFAYSTIAQSIKLLVAAGMITAKRNFSAATTYTILSSPPQYGVAIDYSTLNKSSSYPITTPQYGGLDSVSSLADAQRELMNITGWSRIPGNPDDGTHALGAVLDIYSSRDDAKEWLTKCFNEFRKQYPRSTRIFWLTEWAVQGVIPEGKANGKSNKKEVWAEEWA